MDFARVRRGAFVVVAGCLLAACTGKPATEPAETVAPEQARHHVGQRRRVCGIVASASYAPRTKGRPTFLNLNQPYPNQIFTVVIWGRDRAKFSAPPDSYYQGKKICVTGRIVQYRGRVEIIVRDPSQIDASE